jgi:hypothetical protein
MKTLLFAGCALACVALSGCAGLGSLMPSTTTNPALQQILNHVETCDRIYQGGTGVPPTFTFQITCKAAAPGAIVAPVSTETPK